MRESSSSKCSEHLHTNTQAEGLVAAKRTLVGEGEGAEGGEAGATPLADNNALMLLSTVNIYKPAYAHTKKKKRGKQRHLLIWRRDATFPLPSHSQSFHPLQLPYIVRPVCPFVLLTIYRNFFILGSVGALVISYRVLCRLLIFAFIFHVTCERGTKITAYICDRVPRQGASYRAAESKHE